MRYGSRCISKLTRIALSLAGVYTINKLALPLKIHRANSMRLERRSWMNQAKHKFGLAWVLVVCTYCIGLPAVGFPPPSELPENVNMPNPFLRLDGTGPKTQAEWPGHREYLKAMLQHYFYGHLPPKPSREQVSFERTSSDPVVLENSGIEAVADGYDVTVSRNGLSHTFQIEVWRSTEDRRYPTIFNILGKDEPGIKEALKRGYLYVHIRRKTVAPDQRENADKREGIFRLYPDYDWRTIAAWAWSYQVVIDVVEDLGLLDPDKIIATGHSRGGQTAIAAAIFDDRIDLVAPCTGGFWSVGSHRQRDPDGIRGRWDLAYWMESNQPHWYHPRYWEFGYDRLELRDRRRMNKLPWDAATKFALLAPRPVCQLNVINDPYNNVLSQEAGIRVGQEVYRWWGKQQWVRMHWRDETNQFGQKGHDFGLEEYLALLDFCDEYFFGKGPGATDWNRAPGQQGWAYDPDAHPLMIDWSLP